MDAQRAIAVLNRASENHMYDAERIPEGDAEKITAAEQIVQLCHQVEQVVRGSFPGETDERVIAQKVPHWPGVVRILAEAEGKMVASGPSAVQYVEQEPEVVAPVQRSPEPAVEPPAPIGEAPVPVAASSAPSLDRRDPASGEVWLDQMGSAWTVLHYSGGTSAEVRSVVSGEKTIVPAGFLKTYQSAVPIPGQGAEAPVVVDQAQDVGEAVDYALSDDPPAESPVEKDASTNAAQLVSEEIKDAIDTDVDPEPDSENDQTPTQQQYDELVDGVESRYMPTGMPFPTDLEAPPETHAEMFADVDDATARILHSKYNALAARAKYLHDLEDAISRECDLVRTYHMRRALGKARHEAEKDATLKEVTMVAETDELVSEWAGYARSHSEEARALKTFHDIYTQHVVVLSRDWSMREAQVR